MLQKKTNRIGALSEKLQQLTQPVASDALMLFLPEGWPEREAEVRWVLRGARGILREGACRLEELPKDVARGRLVVWTPGAETLLTEATLPTRSRNKILQALPFALEEQLLGEPEQMHFAYRALGGGRLAVAVTERARLQAWQERLQAAGLRPLAICPVSLALPLADGAWSFAFIDDRLAVRTGPYTGFECMLAGTDIPAIFLAAVQEARGREEAPRQLDLYNAPEALDHTAWAAELRLPLKRHEQSLWQQVEAPPLNLLQNGGAGAHPALRRMRPAAILFGVWLVGAFGFDVWEWWQLSGQERAQRTEMTELFRKTFPEARAVVDPALQMERNLADLKARGGTAGAGDLLPLLGQIAPAIKTNPAIELQGFQYADTGVTLDLHSPDFQALEAVKNAIAARGLEAEIVTSNSRGSGVDGRLRVSARRPS